MEEYSKEFLRLAGYAVDMMDWYFTIITFITGLGTTFAGMPTTGLTLEEVMELAKEIEQKLIRQGVMPDYY